MKNRQYSLSDQFCIGLDQAIRTIFNKTNVTERQNPALHEPEPTLTREQQQQSARLMRVNHAGEVCAQALYQGQGWVSPNLATQQQMRQAAIEENDHLAWCSQRLAELGSHTSYLNPLWYFGSLMIGVTAGWVGDSWSLGFVAETETQVVTHLEKHLGLLPKEDRKSIKILREMQQDESRHRDQAILAGATELPQWIKKGMRLASKLMVKTAYWI